MQTAEASQSRIEGTQREQPAPVTGQNIGAHKQKVLILPKVIRVPKDQYPLKRSGFLPSLDTTPKVFYRDNPLSVDNALNEMKPVWTNTFFAVPV